jgi:excisionase family DNA binding protein
MTAGESSAELHVLLAALEERVKTVPASSIPAALGDLERIKTLLWLRTRERIEPLPRTEPLDELRHLTPSQVAELLNLKEPYVHELCRSRRLPALKQGKYWIISLARLRAWLAEPGGGIDGNARRERSLPDAARVSTSPPPNSGHTPPGIRSRDRGARTPERAVAPIGRRSRRGIDWPAPSQPPSGRGDDGGTP